MSMGRIYGWWCLLLLLVTSTTYAQENMSVRESYLRAEEYFRIGLFEQSIECLNIHLKEYDSKMKANAYRLMALCFLATDHEEDAIRNVHLMLKLVSDYTATLQDPERFSDLVDTCRDKGIRVVTASQQSEKTEEVPVPITLITESMIKDCGARNLKEVLLAYVPGMTSVESVSEMNIAMHGIYSSGQQKILIMQDGHRLNSHSMNAAAPDYSISLDKIKQVEVLRTPASSLYGNVALTAVINLITKEGADINGGIFSVGLGSYRSLKADFMVGKHLLDGDFMLWGAYYSSNGQLFFYPEGKNGNLIPGDGYAIINGFKNKPSYDCGFRIKWSHFYFSASLQHSKMVQPFSPLQGGLFCGQGMASGDEGTQSFFPMLGNLFTYSNYTAFDGLKPGNSRNTTRVEAGHVWNKGEFSTDIAIYADFEKSSNYDVAGDTIPRVVSIVPTGTEDILYLQRGVFQILNWNDYTYGINSKVRYDYRFREQDGNILGGIQFEQYNLYSTSFHLGDHYNRIVWTAPPEEERLLTGIDRSLSLFLQSKQYINRHILLNSGIRYDYKIRSEGNRINAFSPRFSIVYLMNRMCNLKAGYSHAFVDAPFFYRNNTTKAYQGGAGLKPEFLDAVFLNFIWNSGQLGLSYDCNLYYNHVSNLICKSDINGQPYRNAGKVDVLGLENTLNYHTGRLDTYLTLSYMRLLNAQDYNFSGHLVRGIPEFSSHLVAGYDVLSGNRVLHNLRIQTNITAYSRQHGLSGRFLLNAGLIYKYKRNIEFSGWLYNALNTSYQIDGDAGIPIQQSGKWFFGKLTIKL